MAKGRKNIDTGQLDYFDILEDLSRRQARAASQPSTAGKASIDAAIRSIITDSLKRCQSRYDAAAKMSEILGVEITKSQLDAWSAESKENHRFPIVYAAAFCQATGDTSLLRYVAELCGGYFIEGRDAIHVALGRTQEELRELVKKRRLLKEMLRNSGGNDA